MAFWIIQLLKKMSEGNTPQTLSSNNIVEQEVNDFIQRGNKLVYEGNIPEAVEVFSKAIEIAPDNPFVYDMRASGMWIYLSWQ